MALTFKTKQIPSNIDLETENLADFLILNKNYIEITFAVLSRKVKRTSNIVRNINGAPEIDTVNNNADFSEYCDLMGLFYDTDIDAFKKRRGFLLELVVRTIKPVCGGTCLVIAESYVFHNGIKMSKCDIDVVLQYNQLDFIECKADVGRYLYTPLALKKKIKLTFMEDVRKVAIDEGNKSDIFFATYGSEELSSLQVLQSNGFKNFNILTRSKIIGRI